MHIARDLERLRPVYSGEPVTRIGVFWELEQYKIGFFEEDRDKENI